MKQHLAKRNISSWSHDHSFFEELLEGLTPILREGKRRLSFWATCSPDLLQIYLLLLVILFVVFWLQSFVDTGRMQRKLAGLKSVWGYLLAFALGLLSPFCSCGIIPVLMGLVAAGVPVAVCLCMYTTASLMNLTALTALLQHRRPGLHRGLPVLLAFDCGGKLGDLFPAALSGGGAGFSAGA